MKLELLSGVGQKLCEKLAKLRIFNQLDLLLHLPKSYQDRTQITPIGYLQLGQSAQIQGMIQGVEILPARRRILSCNIYDGSGVVSMKFFHFYSGMQQQLKEGMDIRCFGPVSGQIGRLDMIHPEWRIMNASQNPSLEERLTPMYTVTEGIRPPKMAQLVQSALTKGLEWLEELLPRKILQHYRFLSLPVSLEFIHAPPVGTNIQKLNEGNYPAQRRLVYEELLSNQMKKKRNQARRAYPVMIKGYLVKAFIQSLSFDLTTAQARVSEEILQDMQKPAPMGRLVQGDVGCGKTIVAALSMLGVVENNFQSVLLAPTEILAEQHYLNFSKWLEPLNINCVLLIGKLSAKQKRERLEVIAEGKAHIIIGTHAVFQKEVRYKNLALVVIVEQRLELLEKGLQSGYYPHQLTMTATPIPRTMAMTIYGDLDISVIDELPKDRIPIQTVVLPYHKRSEMITRLGHHFAEKKQAYWVCPLIESSEHMETLQDAEALFEELTETFKGFQVGLVHGRLKPKEKTEMMAQFKAGEIDLLVATTVIEVGVDVPNASIMIIENPERLGLSQLHQLRGRVGRGDQQSSCVLLYNSEIGQTSKARLKVIRESNDGFVIAEEDLKLRGPGEVLGTKQTGDIGFKIAVLERDYPWFEVVKKDAEMMVQEHPEQSEKIVDRWLGNVEEYTQA